MSPLPPKACLVQGQMSLHYGAHWGHGTRKPAHHDPLPEASLLPLSGPHVQVPAVGVGNRKAWSFSLSAANVLQANNEQNLQAVLLCGTTAYS